MFLIGGGETKMKKSLEDIAEESGRFSSQAVRFVSEGLSHTIKKTGGEPGHVTGQTLCDGLRKMALERWGRLAMLVLNSWGIKTTRDFGEIVYSLVKHKWISAQPTDSINDFDDVYDFRTVFKDQFRFQNPPSV
jgi:uncharacterized repeat protein (TIGR04138 family)